MYYVYVLFSDVDRMLYTGSTKDLRQRWKDHCAGRADATKDRRPLRIIYYEAYPTKLEAERREKYLKGGNGRAQLKRQLGLTLTELGYRFLSQPTSQAPKAPRRGDWRDRDRCSDIAPR